MATPAVLLGQNYGAVLEHPERYRVEGGDAYLCREHHFPAEVVDPMLALIDRRGLFEVKQTIELDGCVVVSKADYIRGLSIEEYKTTLSTFDAEKYLQSCQWRWMALMFEAAEVRYRVACLSEDAAGRISLRSIENLTVYPYPGLRDDCRALLREFVHYVKLRGLEGHLRAKQIDAARQPQLAFH